MAVAVALLAGCAGATSSADPPAGAARTSATALDGLIRHAPGTAYYLALGDSLSVGLQPGPNGHRAPTAQGYPEQLAGMLRTKVRGLRLAVLGCSGETTGTMIRGGICHYPAGSQLAQATAFLRAHRGHVALITIDIGANDPNSCVLATRLSAMPACLSAGVSTARRNLSVILARLRAAGGRNPLLVGMNYYVPELGLWPAGRNGAELAVLSERLASGFGQLLASEYRRSGGRVADVFGAFGSSDFTGRVRVAGVGTLPRNVAKICALTWMCARPPAGPDEHANAAGYQVIARAFYRAIAS